MSHECSTQQQQRTSDVCTSDGINGFLTRWISDSVFVCIVGEERRSGKLMQ